MSLIAYTKFRFLWGAVDWQQGTDNPYGTAQTADLGPSAVAGVGIGVRRVILTFDRTVGHPGADAAECHFDFLNMTAGAPDDTWTSADYTTLEGYLNTFWSSVRSMFHTGIGLTMYSWYREGPGVTKPNPAERQYVIPTPVYGSSANCNFPPQTACSITFRTSVRRSWGRTYLPLTSRTLGLNGYLANADVDTIATAASTLVTSAASSDFYLVVTSRKLSTALNVEKIEVDNNLDVVRRRRWKTSSYKKLLP